MVLNVSSLNSSFTTGFSDTIVTPQPFHSVGQDDLALTFSIGFEPQLLLTAGVSVSADIVSADGGIGMFLDLPQLSANISTLHNTSATCNGTAPKNETNTYVHIVPQAEYGVGAQWELDVDLLREIKYKRGGLQDFETGVQALPTECVLIEKKVISTSTTTSGTSTATATGKGGHKNAAVNPRLDERTGVLVVVACVLAICLEMV